MNPIIGAIGIFLVALQPLFSQPLTTINQPNDFICADVYGQVYAVNGPELIKYDKNGNPLQRYCNNKLGTIANADVTNPLKLLLFYHESNSVVFLDQNLIEITGALDIYEMAGFEASLTCSSSDGGFWLWNPVQQTANHYTDQRVSDRQTQCLSDWLTGNAVTCIQEFGQKLLVVASNKILVFDYFGTYLNKWELEQVKNMSFTDQTLFWLKDNKIMTYQWQSHQTGEIALPESKTPKQAAITNGKMILGFDKSIEIYNLK